MPQKKSLKKMEKQQSDKSRKGKAEKTRADKIIGSVDIPDVDDEEFMSQLKRMKAITPTGVASQFNLKVSIANRLLEELREKKVIDLVAKSHNLKVYAFSQN